MAITNSCAVSGYGVDSNPIYSIIKPTRAGEQQDQPMAGSNIDEQASKDFDDALQLWNRTNNVILKRFGDSNILPYVHATLVFINHLAHFPDAIALVAPTFPWKLMSLMLNTLQISPESYARIQIEGFPLPTKNDLLRCLPEDYALSGLLWGDKYFPSDWFKNDKTEADERMLELSSMVEERKIRCLFPGYRIAQQNKWLKFDPESRQFGVAPEHDTESNPVELLVSGAKVQNLPCALQSVGAVLAPGGPPFDHLAQC